MKKKLFINPEMRSFLRISKDWQLTEEQEMSLVGKYPGDLHRLRSLIDIYRNLHLIFTNRKQADAWIHKPNRAFEERTALEVMTEDPQVVKNYLDGHLGEIVMQDRKPPVKKGLGFITASEDEMANSSVKEWAQEDDWAPDAGLGDKRSSK